MITNKGQRGQILPLGLAALLIGALALSISYRLSLRLIQREEARMRTDVIAFSGAVQYSRSLNLLAACEKVILAGWAATVITLGEFYSVQDRILSAVNYFVKYGPWLTEASTLANGVANGQIAIPFWNQKALLDGELSKLLTPSFNVKIRDVADVAGDLAEQAAGPQQELFSKDQARESMEGWLGKLNQPGQDGGNSPLADLLGKALPKATSMLEASGYSYKRRSDGQTVVLGKDQAGPVQEKKKGGGSHQVYKTNDGTRYVSKQGDKMKMFSMDVQETGPHYLTVLTLDTPWFGEGPKPGWVLCLAQVQIDGGSLDMLSFSKGGGMAFRPRFVPVRLLGEKAKTQEIELDWEQMQDALGPLVQMMGENLQGSDWQGLVDVGEALGQGFAVQH